MFLIAGLALLCIGAFMLLVPEMVFELQKSWKSYSASEPSDLYILSTRIGGGLFSLMGAAAVVVQFVI